MAYDIYGGTLERGHCEVHPWVGEEYPCSLCCIEQKQDIRNKRQEEEYNSAMEIDYWHSIHMVHSDEYRILHEREEKLKRLLQIIQERKQEAIKKILQPCSHF